MFAAGAADVANVREEYVTTMMSVDFFTVPIRFQVLYTPAFRRSTMRSLLLLRRSPVSFVTLTVILFIAVSSAQQGGGRGEGPDTLADTPQILGNRGQRFRVTPIKGLFRPSALAFLPNGDILVAERSGGLRIVHNGVLDPQPIGNTPTVVRGPARRFGLWDVALHPRFAENRLIYFEGAAAVDGASRGARCVDRFPRGHGSH